jgi:hypothetical protein
MLCYVRNDGYAHIRKKAILFSSSTLLFVGLKMHFQVQKQLKKQGFVTLCFPLLTKAVENQPYTLRSL